MTTSESDNADVFAGVTIDEWQSAFASNIIEFAASRFVFSYESSDTVRISFGNGGPFTDSTGNRGKPRYTHAVTLNSALAVEIAQVLIQNIAKGPASSV